MPADSADAAMLMPPLMLFPPLAFDTRHDAASYAAAATLPRYASAAAPCHLSC